MTPETGAWRKGGTADRLLAAAVFIMLGPIAQTVPAHWSFRMTGLSGFYQFTVSSDRPPFVKATRVTVDGTEAPATAGVDRLHCPVGSRRNW